MSWNTNKCVITESDIVSLFVRLWVEITFVAAGGQELQRQPLREAVSWNVIFRMVCPFRYAVSLFVRLWVEMFCQKNYFTRCFVSLFVRLWVEISTRGPAHSRWKRQPLREAVSWNISPVPYRKQYCSQPLREAVSWNMTGDYMVAVQEGQPLREAVSWNSLCQRNLTEKVGSASSWGCELKYYSLIITGKCFTVSLFVRLWVEMYDRGWNDALEKSASSWGCELK